MSKVDLDELWGQIHYENLTDDEFKDAVYDYYVERKDALKTQIRELIDETFDKNDAKAYELWKKVEAL